MPTVAASADLPLSNMGKVQNAQITKRKLKNEYIKTHTCIPATRAFQKACNKWASFAQFNLLH